MFIVRVGEFEGPLDLLLDLIERRKLHVSEVPLSAITEDYLAAVRALETLPAGEVAHFVLIASMLLLIKSKSLLPGLSLSEEETSDIKELENRLAFLERVRSLAYFLRARFGKVLLFEGGLKRVSVVIFSPSADISHESLRDGLRRALTSMPLFEKLPERVVEKIISLETMMKRLAERIEKSFSIGFQEFSKAHASEKKSVIVGFLALLELVKQGIVQAAQESHFDDIRIHKDKVGTPEYN